MSPRSMKAPSGVQVHVFVSPFVQIPTPICSLAACYLKLWFRTEQSEPKQSEEALPPLPSQKMLALVRPCTLRAQVGRLSLWNPFAFLRKISQRGKKVSFSLRMGGQENRSRPWTCLWA